VKRRDFLKHALAGAAAVVAMPLAPLLPAAPRFVPFTTQYDVFPGTLVEAGDSLGAWQTFEWDDTPFPFTPFDPEVDAFEVVFHNSCTVEHA